MQAFAWFCFFVSLKRFILADEGFHPRFRFAQCLRRYRDTKEAFPHLANAGKYSTTFFVVLFSTLNTAWALLSDNKQGYNPFFYLWISSSVLR